MIKAFIVIFIFFSSHCFGQEIPLPKGYEMLEEKSGDLDKDGINEKAIVYNTDDTTDNGIVRELQIFKLINNEWKLWKKSRHAILKSQEGGMSGDPFAGIDVKNGLLIIRLEGGSSWKWSYSDKYKYQNGEFMLIGHSGYNGKACEFWDDIDFNLLTGKIIYKREYEDCEKGQEIYKRENETFFKKGISININSRRLKEYKIISPKYKHELDL